MSTMLYATAENPVNYSPLIYAFVIIFVAIGAIVGYSRGIKRQFVRSITVVISFFTAYALTAYGTHLINLFLSDKTMGDVHAWLITFRFIEATDDVSWIYNIDVNAVRELFKIPFSLVVVPVMFVVAFSLISVIMLIVHKIISALCGFKKRKNTFNTRFFGMLLGTVQGVLVSAILLTPVLGLSAMAKDSVAIAKNYAPNEPFTEICEEKYDAYVKTASENPLILLYSRLGGNFLYENLVTVDVDGTPTNMTELLPDAVKITSDSARLWGVDAKNLTPEDEANINKILATVKANVHIRKIVAGAVSSASYLYTNGNLPFTVEEPFKSIINSAVGIFHTSNAENISEDLDTLSEVYFILSRDGVLASFDKGADEMLKALTTKNSEGKTAVERVVGVMRSNERTKPLVTLITKLSVTVMADRVGIDENALTTLDNIKNGITENILSIEKESYDTEEEYVADISSALDATLKENSIVLEKKIIDTMAEYVSENFSDIEILTDDAANDIIISYYDAYLEYLETGKIPKN